MEFRLKNLLRYPIIMKKRKYVFRLGLTSVVVAFLLWNSLKQKGLEQHSHRMSTHAHDRRISDYFSKQSPVECRKVFARDASAIEEAVDFDIHRRNVSILPDEAYLNLTADCDAFLDTRGYVRRPLSEEEAAFPIAFSITFYQHVEEFERLLRLIYHPQNVYCIYIDLKAHPAVLQATQSIVRCLPNVFIAENRTNVIYGSFSLLEALSLTCGRQLLQYEWKYYVNLVSQMFPLRTNHELVQLFKLLAGFNLVEGLQPEQEWRYGRMKSVFRVPDNTETPYALPVNTYQAKSAAPFNLTYVVGGTNVAASRALVEFVFSNDMVQRYTHWLEDTYIPDEAFWTTVNWNTKVLRSPGGHDLGVCQNASSVFIEPCVPRLVRYVRWGRPCGNGTLSRGIGIFNEHCLPDMIASPVIAANKFHLDYHKTAYECMEEWYTNRTQSGVQLKDSPHFLSIYNAVVKNMQQRNDSYYQNSLRRPE